MILERLGSKVITILWQVYVREERCVKEPKETVD